MENIFKIIAFVSLISISTFSEDVIGGAFGIKFGDLVSDKILTGYQPKFIHGTPLLFSDSLNSKEIMETRRDWLEVKIDSSNIPKVLLIDANWVEFSIQIDSLQGDKIIRIRADTHLNLYSKPSVYGKVKIMGDGLKKKYTCVLFQDDEGAAPHYIFKGGNGYLELTTDGEYINYDYYDMVYYKKYISNLKKRLKSIENNLKDAATDGL